MLQGTALLVCNPADQTGIHRTLPAEANLVLQGPDVWMGIVSLEKGLCFHCKVTVTTLVREKLV